MHRLIFSYLLLQYGVCFGQNIKLEITDYSRKIKDKEYGTFQFVRSSYSFSRSTLVLITNRPTFIELTTKIPGLFDRKQEYTDIWVLGISYLDTSKISDVDKEIISTFFQKIIKYRSDNNLLPYTLQQLEASSKYLLKKEEICKFISCKNRL